MFSINIVRAVKVIYSELVFFYCNLFLFISQNKGLLSSLVSKKCFFALHSDLLHAKLHVLIIKAKILSYLFMFRTAE